jgi:hypothetical protein
MDEFFNFGNTVDFEDAFDIEIEDENQSKYIEIPKYKYKTIVNYKNAEALAKEIKLHENSNHYIIVSGKFVMGDFYGYLLKENNLIAKEFTVSTLSYSEQNIKSFRTLLAKGYIQKLNVIVSGYFYRHERHKLIKFTYETLDPYDFQLAVNQTHTKTTAFETTCGLNFVIHGSANLRSCQCEEQIQITECKKLFTFVTDYNNSIISNFKTINK